MGRADTRSGQLGVGRSPTYPKGGWVGLRTLLLRDARHGLRQRLVNVLAMPLQPIANFSRVSTNVTCA